MKRTKLLVWLNVVAACSVFLSCNKQNMQQLPTNQLTTTTANLKTDATGVLLTEAMVLAQKFLQLKNPNTKIIIKTAETVTKNGVPYMHIINANKGWVILSADSLYTPILAYDSINNFDKNNINPGLAMWFNKHGREMDFMRSAKSARTDSIIKDNKLDWVAYGSDYTVNHLAKNIVGKPSSPSQTQVTPANPDGGNIITVVTNTAINYFDNTVGPLLKSTFNQNAPYNFYCPDNDPAGCVPVAMGQIMGFWQYSNKNYDWGVMPIHEPLGTTISGYYEAARLLHDIGTAPAVNVIGGAITQFAHYGSNNTWANDYNCPLVFYEFGYSSATMSEDLTSQYFSGGKNGTSYADLLFDETYNQNRPCMVGGFTNQSWYLITVPSGDGHEWVCDGAELSYMAVSQTIRTYDLSSGTRVLIGQRNGVAISNLLKMLHMNWGWGGRNNGWYNSAINYTNTSNGDFNYFQTVITNIHP